MNNYWLDMNWQYNNHGTLENEIAETGYNNIESSISVIDNLC